MKAELLDIDYRVFKFLNSFAGESYVRDWIFIFFADVVVFLLIAGLTFFILQKRQRDRYRACIEALVSAAVGKIIFGTLLNFLFFRERPFVGFNVVQLILMDPSKASYPSGHATLLFAIATSIFLHNKKWGSAYLILAFLSSIARVIVGVHFPSDIFAGMCIGIFSACLVYGISSRWLQKNQLRVS